ncbi:MAG: hypothetical protein K6E35_04630 [Bacteroidales bacterium]|nr:hypothetical protein [Bacteroidales bacterium]
METNDKTMLEMQQQIQQLQKKLDDQKIVSDQMLRRACARGIDSLRYKARLPMIAASLAVLCGVGSFHNLGFSLALILFTLVIVLVALVASMRLTSHLPEMDSDLVSATEEVSRFRKGHADWIKYGIPILVVWLGWMVCELFFIIPSGIDPELVVYLASGLVCGLVIGLFLGLRNRRKILDSADKLLEQIEELKKGQ